MYFSVEEWCAEKIVAGANPGLRRVRPVDFAFVSVACGSSQPVSSRPHAHRGWFIFGCCAGCCFTAILASSLVGKHSRRRSRPIAFHGEHELEGDSERFPDAGSVGIDSSIEVAGTPKSYSADLRRRVIEAVASGASRHEAVELFGIAVSRGIKWWPQGRDTRSVEPKPCGGTLCQV
jgi:hypothetical protein